MTNKEKSHGTAVADRTAHEMFLHRAIELSRKASIEEKTGGVFGAVIVKDGKIIAEGYNKVTKENDPTWHGEMEAIRVACKKLKTPHLEGCTLYTSSEPCPMCLATAYWARIEDIYYAAKVEDARQYGDFIDDMIYAEIRKAPAQRSIPCEAVPSMRDEALVVWKEFSKLNDRARY